MKIALLTYNCIGEAGEYQNGWLELNGHSIFIGQNSKGLEWGSGPIPISQDPDSEFDELGNPAKQYSESRKEIVFGLAEQLKDALHQLDLLVVYLGVKGSEAGLALASELPAEKIAIVTCGCEREAKHEMVKKVGLINAGKITCSCGGQSKMKKLLEEMIELLTTKWQQLDPQKAVMFEVSKRKWEEV